MTKVGKSESVEIVVGMRSQGQKKVIIVRPVSVRSTSGTRFVLYEDNSLSIVVWDELGSDVSADLSSVEILEKVIKELKS